MGRIDSSIEGFAKVGIKISEQQFRDFCGMNLSFNSEGKDVPLLNMIMLLKYFGLIPKEMLVPEDDSLSEFEKMTGARKKDDEK